MKKIILSTLTLGVLLSTSAIAEDFKGSIEIGIFQSDDSKLSKVKIPMVKAIAIATNKVKGKVTKAELETEDGYFVYKIEIVSSKDKEIEVYIDPVTAKILKTEEDD